MAHDASTLDDTRLVTLDRELVLAFDSALDSALSSAIGSAHDRAPSRVLELARRVSIDDALVRVTAASREAAH